jgi:hypothetical protein
MESNSFRHSIRKQPLRRGTIQAVRKVIISNQDQLLNQLGDRCEAYMRRVWGQQSKGGPHKNPGFSIVARRDSLAGALCAQWLKRGWLGLIREKN